MGQIEPASESLGADENVDSTRLNFLIEASEIVGFLVVAIKTGNFSVRKETSKLGFEKLGAESFVNNAGMMAVWTARRDFFTVSANMTTESVGVSMEDHWQIAFWAESLPTTFLTDSERCGSTTIMKNKSLMFSLNVIFYFCQKLVRKITISAETGAVFKIDNADFRVKGGSFGLSGKLRESVFGLSEIIVGKIRSGGTENAGDFETASHKTSKASSGITRGVFLIISAFMGLVDDD